MAGKRKPKQPPIWKRLGYKTEWAYRTAKAQAKGYSGEAEERRVRSLQKYGVTPSQRQTARRRARRAVGQILPYKPEVATPTRPSRARNQDMTERYLSAIRAWEKRSSWKLDENAGRTLPGDPDLDSVHQRRRRDNWSFATAIRQFNEKLASNPAYVRDFYFAFVDTLENDIYNARIHGKSAGFYTDVDGRQKALSTHAFREMVLRWAPQIPAVGNYLSAEQWQARYGTMVYGE